MGDKLRYICLLETRRLLLLMGVIFAFVLCVQYFELPYSNIFSSLFSTSKSQVAIIENLPSINPSNFNSSNSTDLNVVDGALSTTNVSDANNGKVTNVRDDFEPENSQTSNETLIDDIDPEEESPSKDLLQIDGENSTVEGIVRKDSFPLEKPGEIAEKLPESETISKFSGALDHNGTSVKDGGKIVIQETPPVTSTGKDAENIHQNNIKPKITKKKRYGSCTYI